MFAFRLSVLQFIFNWHTEPGSCQTHYQPWLQNDKLKTVYHHRNWEGMRCTLAEGQKSSADCFSAPQQPTENVNGGCEKLKGRGDKLYWRELSPHQGGGEPGGSEHQLRHEASPEVRPSRLGWPDYAACTE